MKDILDKKDSKEMLIDLSKLTDGEIIETKKFGILNDDHKISENIHPSIHKERPSIEKHFVNVPHKLNEAHNYEKPTSFLRALRLELGDYYNEFNKIRTSFYRWLGLDPMPATTRIQTTLCWEILLIKTEEYAIYKSK